MSLPTNCTMVFQTPVKPTRTVSDPLGNNVPETRPVTVLATLRPSRSSYFANRVLGEALQPGEMAVTGRSTSPKNVDFSALPRECRVAITDPVIGKNITGTLVLDAPLQSKFKAVTKALGCKFTGKFTEDRGWA